MIIAVQTIWRLLVCFALYLNQKQTHLLSISVQFQEAPCQDISKLSSFGHWRCWQKYPSNPSVDQITNMSFSGFSIQNCGQPVTSTPRLMGCIKASAFNILWIPHSLWCFFYSVSYLPYKELFYSHSNKGTAGSQKSPVTTKSVLVIQIT